MSAQFRLIHQNVLRKYLRKFDMKRLMYYESFNEFLLAYVVEESLALNSSRIVLFFKYGSKWDSLAMYPIFPFWVPTTLLKKINRNSEKLAIFNKYSPDMRFSTVVARDSVWKKLSNYFMNNREYIRYAPRSKIPDKRLYRYKAAWNNWGIVQHTKSFTRRFALHLEIHEMKADGTVLLAIEGFSVFCPIPFKLGSEVFVSLARDVSPTS